MLSHLGGFPLVSYLASLRPCCECDIPASHPAPTMCPVLCGIGSWPLCNPDQDGCLEDGWMDGLRANLSDSFRNYLETSAQTCDSTNGKHFMRWLGLRQQLHTRMGRSRLLGRRSLQVLMLPNCPPQHQYVYPCESLCLMGLSTPTVT